MKREITLLQHAVRLAHLEGEIGSRVALRIHDEQAGAHLVLRPVVRSGVKVTGSTRSQAVAAHLHVPEERLAQHNSSFFVLDEVVQIGRFRNLPLTQGLGFREWLGGAGGRRRNRVNGHPSAKHESKGRFDSHFYAFCFIDVSISATQALK